MSRAATEVTKSTSPQIDLELQPKQDQLFQLVQNSEATTIGYGGSKGGGKSRGGRDILYVRRLIYPNTNGLIFRRTWADVRDNHIKPLLQERPYLRKYYNKAEHTIRIPWTNSEIVFGTAEHEKDILNFHGKPYADILIDEAQRCTPWMIQKLKESNRCTTNLDITPKMILSMNPGDLGHSYLKRVFIDRSYIENEVPSDYAFLQAYGWDNVMWVLKALRKDGFTPTDFYSWPAQKRMIYFATRSDYGKKLASLPDSDRRAQMFGDWNIYAGQFFNMLRADLHLKKPIDIPADWRKLGTIDWGQRAVLEIQACDFKGTVWNFGEVYTEHQAATPRAIAMAEYLLAKKLFNLDIQYDTNMDIDLSEVGYEKVPLATFERVFQELMGDKKPRLYKVTKQNIRGKDYRAGCNDVVKEYLDWASDKTGRFTRRPKCYITTDCPELWKSISSLQHPPKDATGMDFDQKVGTDDAFDAFKMTLMGIVPAKELEKPREKEWYETLHPVVPRGRKIVDILDPYNV